MSSRSASFVAVIAILVAAFAVYKGQVTEGVLVRSLDAIRSELRELQGVDNPWLPVSAGTRGVRTEPAPDAAEPLERSG